MLYCHHVACSVPWEQNEPSKKGQHYINETRIIRFRTMVGGEDGGLSGAKNKKEYRNPKGCPVCVSQTKP